MVAALGILLQIHQGPVESDFPLLGELDSEWYHDAAGDELWTDPVVPIGGEHHKGQKCERSFAGFFEAIITPEIELRAKVEAPDTGLMENSKRVVLSGADRTVRLPDKIELGGVCNSNSHVRREELELIGDGSFLIWSRSSVADDGCFKLHVSCVNCEWALRKVGAIGRHLA